MNYYNPFFGMNPYSYVPATTASKGLLSGILGRGFNWSTILTNTQKTLGVVNQAIPLIKQASPIVSNAKTMFKVMNEFKKNETPVVNTKNVNTISNNISNNDDTNKTITSSSNGPVFFL